MVSPSQVRLETAASSSMSSSAETPAPKDESFSSAFSVGSGKVAEVVTSKGASVPPGRSLLIGSESFSSADSFASAVSGSSSEDDRNPKSAGLLSRLRPLGYDGFDSLF